MTTEQCLWLLTASTSFWLLTILIVYWIMHKQQLVILALLHKHTELNIHFFNAKLMEQGMSANLGVTPFHDVKQQPDEPI